jgi:acyl carrier protein
MDFLRFVMELHRQLGVEVPEVDYQKLGSLSGAVDYVAARLGVPAQ